MTTPKPTKEDVEHLREILGPFTQSPYSSNFDLMRDVCTAYLAQAQELEAKDICIKNAENFIKKKAGEFQALEAENATLKAELAEKYKHILFLESEKGEPL